MGFSCALQAAIVANTVDSSKSYFLPATYFDKMETLNQLDLLSSEFNAYVIDPQYKGIDSWKIN